MRETYYHGNHERLEKADLFSGFCLTSDRGAALNYAMYRGSGYLYAVTVEMAGLTRQTIDCDLPADGEGPVSYPEQYGVEGVDVIEFQDSDRTGRHHDTVALMTDVAVACIVEMRLVDTV